MSDYLTDLINKPNRNEWEQFLVDISNEPDQTAKSNLLYKFLVGRMTDKTKETLKKSIVMPHFNKASFPELTVPEYLDFRNKYAELYFGIAEEAPEALETLFNTRDTQKWSEFM